MVYNFDEIIDRSGTGSIKHSDFAALGRPADTIPLWVADMDFRSPPAVTEAVKKEAEHGIFGYTAMTEGYFASVLGWQKDRFGWEIDPDWLVGTSGVVNSIAIAILALTEPGDGILIQRPVYHPFFLTIEGTGRTVVNSSLVLENGRYEIDFADFEKQIVENKPKLFILCSPHNPVSRVWSKEELLRMGEICKEHGVLVLSDEIHQDFIYTGQHYNLANLDPSFLEFTITSTAPSKTFNMPGLEDSNIFIPNPVLRKKFKALQSQYGVGGINKVGLAACEAAYRDGADWLNALIRYLQKSIAFIETYLAEYLPEVKLIQPEGTYLLWLDFRELGLSHDALEDLISNKARLWLNGGYIFGPEGEGFQRMNIGCPRSIIIEAMDRLRDAISAL